MAYLVPTISYTQAAPIIQLGSITSVSGTVTGTAGFGSSLFLSRMFLPGEMALTEVQAAIGMSFNATSNGAGTISRSLVIYSFGNSTSLASLISTSGSSAWTTGTSTAGASVSLTQFQGGWSGNVIQPMTFASQFITPGDYVVGQLFNFAQLSSTWSVSLFGQGAASLTFGTAGAQTSAGLLAASVMSSGGLAGQSLMSSGGLAVESLLASGGLSAASAITGIVSIATGVAGNTNWLITHASSAVSSASQSFSTGTYTLVQVGQVNALSTVAGSIFTATTSTAGSIFTASTSTAGSIFTATTSQSASLLTASTAVSAFTVGGQGPPPVFAYIGTGSTTAMPPTRFVGGIMSTGGIPASIALSALTMSGSTAQIQPWFALCGI